MLRRLLSALRVVDSIHICVLLLFVPTFALAVHFYLLLGTGFAIKAEFFIQFRKISLPSNFTNLFPVSVGRKVKTIARIYTNL